MSTPRQLAAALRLTVQVLRDAIAHLRSRRTMADPDELIETTHIGVEERANLGWCDRCPSRAGAWWERALSCIAFCGHHDREHAPALIDQGWVRTAVDMSVFGKRTVA